MPRAGLNPAAVVLAGADLADEAGLEAVTLAAVAERLGVRAPALYKHVQGIDDLRHRIATLAMLELGDVLRDELQGRAGAPAVAALFTTFRSYVARHPGRYAATTGAELRDGEELFRAAGRVIDSIRAVLSGYDVRPEHLDHAVRMLRCTLHGYAMLEAADGFQWGNDPDETVAWMIGFLDRGLAASGG